MDDYSKFLWTFPLSQKSQTYAAFLNFKSYIRTQFEQDIKSIQCDNGMEFDNKSFREFCQANGKNQQVGVDYGETFSPVVKPETIRTVLSLALSNDWPIHQLDVKNVFLHGELKETVYMHQPLGFRDPDRPNHVCLMKKSLYGLK